MQSWEFGVLGPLQVSYEGTTVPITAPKQRVLLAALAVAGHEAVSVDRLLTLLWGEQPPASAHNTVKNYALRLRRTLTSDSATNPILTTANGYRLGTPVQAVDLFRFVDLEKQARAEVAGGALDSAAGLLEQALQLWRGEPLADVPSELLHQEVGAGLIERHLSVVELGYEVALRRGRHDDVVTDLAALRKRHPLRERLSALAMLARFRCGQAGAALAVYHETATALRDELGVDPGPELQALHQQILRQEPTLHAGDNTVSTSSASVIARQLPAALPGFVGRQAVQEELTELVETAHHEHTMALAVVSGPGGIGKSSLALHWAHQHLDDFPDGQLFVNLRGFDASSDPMPPAEAVLGFCSALGADLATLPADPAAQVALYRTLLTDRRILIVLDNARDAAQVLPLLPGSATCTVLVTSRHRLTTLAVKAGARLLTVGELGDDDATTLLTRQLGPQRIAAEPPAVAELIKGCGGLPLALSIVAARANQHPQFPLAEIARELRATDTRLQSLDAGDQDTNVAAVLSWSYRALPAAAAQALGLLACAPGPDISVPAAARLIGLELTQARSVLRDLEAASLIDQHQPHRYRMHDLVRLYAAELAAATPLEGRAALTRLFDHYEHAAIGAMNVIAPYESHFRPPAITTALDKLPADYDQAVQWLDQERRNLLATADHAALHGWPAHTSHMSSILFRYLDIGGHHYEALTLHSRALTASRQRNDHASQATALRHLGSVCGWLGRHEEAIQHHHQSVSHARMAADPRLERAALDCLGLAYHRANRDPDALTCFEQALAMVQEAKDRFGEARVRNNLGTTYQRLGRYDEALQQHHRALATARDIGDRNLEGFALLDLGCLQLRLGHHEDALNQHHQALAIAHDIGDHSLKIETLNGLGEIFRSLDDPRRSLDQHRQAFTLARRGGNRDELARAHHGLAHAHRCLHQRTDAQHHAEHALAIYKELSSPEADTVHSLLTALMGHSQ